MGGRRWGSEQRVGTRCSGRRGAGTKVPVARGEREVDNGLDDVADLGMPSITSGAGDRRLEYETFWQLNPAQLFDAKRHVKPIETVPEVIGQRVGGTDGFGWDTDGVGQCTARNEGEVSGGRIGGNVASVDECVVVDRRALAPLVPTPASAKDYASSPSQKDG